MIDELTSLEKVCFSEINLTRAFRNEPSSLLECLDKLVTKRHVMKITKIELSSVTIDSIFDAETFCKRFFNRLVQVKELVISKCKPMFIEKFLIFTTGALS